MSAGSSTTAASKHHIDASFDRLARRYDLMCRLNPGYHRHLSWSARRLQVRPGARILDLCCGTGLSTEAIVGACPGARIDGLDASRGMLEHARSKPPLSGVRFLHGDATDPAAAGARGPYDGILMAYGLRNLPDPDRCLDNLRDLLAPGGVLCLHEYSVADSRRSRWLWNLVTTTMVIPLALVVTGSARIFSYLRRSVVEFDGVSRLEQRLRDAGFEGVQTLAVDGWQRGIVHTIRARRPRAGAAPDGAGTGMPDGAPGGART